MIRSAEGRRRENVDDDDYYVDDDNPLFGRINGAPRCVVSLHVTPNKKRSKKRDGIETKYLITCECKVCRKKMTHMCLEYADTDAVKNEIWFYHPRTNSSCFVHHLHSTYDL